MAIARITIVPGRIPRISPNRIRTMSPLNESDRDTMITPSASIATNNSPIAVSDDSRDRFVMKPTPMIITAEPTAAPSIPGAPISRAPATPGSTP